ncbi:MAG: hypothetical protein Ct9H300mP1_19570 [Planctomycetaceae bacterium]|nr:MAG: hypothetical protein Ct9H300mP1_19570 [Planctomycetaceae bacterium]
MQPPTRSIPGSTLLSRTARAANCPNNGLPVFPLYFANDDDGRRKIGSDSRVTFTAPADGDYLVRVTGRAGLRRRQVQVPVDHPRATARLQGLHRRSWTRRSPSAADRGSLSKSTASTDTPARCSFSIDGLPEGFSTTTPVVVQAGHLSAPGCHQTLPPEPRLRPRRPGRRSGSWLVPRFTASQSNNRSENLGTLKIGKAPKVIVSLLLDKPGRSGRTNRRKEGPGAGDRPRRDDHGDAPGEPERV